MTMTNAQIIAALTVLDKLKRDDRRLPVRVSYAINTNISRLLEPHKAYVKTAEELVGGELTP
uniref:Uncharacterized protein n=1 Tax=uncultured bacterium scaffold00056 TaxID=1132475 RepID=I6ZXM0_9BACT|nr:hypothetical protein [uncultured bacterium scaffold00056]